MVSNQDSGFVSAKFRKPALSLFHRRVFYPQEFGIYPGKTLENSEQGDDTNTCVFWKDLVHGSIEDIRKCKKPRDRKTYRNCWKNSGQKFWRSEIKQQQTATHDTAGLINGIGFEDKQTRAWNHSWVSSVGQGWGRKEVPFMKLGVQLGSKRIIPNISSWSHSHLMEGSGLNSQD